MANSTIVEEGYLRRIVDGRPEESGCRRPMLSIILEADSPVFFLSKLDKLRIQPHHEQAPLVDSHIGVCIRPLVILDSHLKGPVYNSLWVDVALL